MLIRFEVENFRSIREPAELSMVAIDEAREGVRSFPGMGVSLVPCAGIFGPNASGKSNVLEALAWLQEAIDESMRSWEDFIDVTPFAFGDSPEKPTSFVLELELGGVRFEYLVDLTRERIDYEALFHYPEGKRRRIFERDGLDLQLQRGLGSLSGVRAMLNDRTLAISWMRKFDEPLTKNFVDAVLAMEIFGVRRGRRKRSIAAMRTAELFLRETPTQGQFLLPGLPGEAERRDALAMLQLADLGVSDVEVDEDGRPRTIHRGRGFRLVHRSDGRNVTLDFDHESEGTKTWFSLIAPLLDSLRRGSLMIFDEIDASLHPTLTSQLLGLFTKSESNPRGAQLLFTSHDTNLLNHLNRDEIWLTEKGADGGTRLGALSDFAGERVRRSANLERGYLSGRFGALPDVTKPDVLRQLGLIG